MLHASPAIEDARTGSTALAPSSSPVLIVLGSVLLCVGLLALPWLSGDVAMARYLYVVLALTLGVVLYRTSPVLYVGYAWWLWFLTPFVRRVIDYYAGSYENPSLILLVPYLVSGLAFFTLLRHRSRLLDKAYFPFVLALAGIAYGYIVGIPKNGPVSASYGVLKWIAPVFLGLHVAFYWRDYPAVRRCIQRTFLWGVAVMGAYAVVQFFVLPPWDSFWMTHVEWNIGPTGRPNPFQVRAFSTMNTFSSFATVMMVGLLVLFSLSTWKHILAAMPGYAGFVLSIVRAAWGGWLMGLVLMALWIKGRMRMRFLGALLLGALIALPLLAVPQISNRLNNRFGTFQNLEEDQSFNARLRLYQSTSASALTNPIGNGIVRNATQWDSGLLVMAYQLGWPGLLLFMMGLTMLMWLAWQGQRRTRDPFAAISTAIALAVLALLPFKNSLSDASGVAFWCFAGLSLASYRYHRAQEGDEEMVEHESGGEQERP